MPVQEVTGGLSAFQKVISDHPEGHLVVVHFKADWADQCKPMEDAVNILTSDPKFKSVLFCSVDAEDQAEVSMEYQVAAVPTFLFFGRVKGAKVKLMDRVEGAKVAEVTKKVKELKDKLEMMAQNAELKVRADSIKNNPR